MVVGVLVLLDLCLWWSGVMIITPLCIIMIPQLALLVP
jgi:hypothetical protein